MLPPSSSLPTRRRCHDTELQDEGTENKNSQHHFASTFIRYS
ncbi:hypothetical protein E2C01_039801 [Portunus trituberculatus]|uniref:Uncharacterized protein n=1 Tax=Portunus trituberculatus TaxID=210409 RepID=A0A5B7FHX7_PORTR|nr:hypothetical protein [Portunus trituberculatus]